MSSCTPTASLPSSLAHPCNPPRNPRPPRPPLHVLATTHLCAASSNLSALTGHAGHVKELWQDMVALDVYDPEIWDVLDLAWEVALGALNLAAQ
ncbi:hypothetical protein DFH09DRAFT_1314819 [Mycena vulgaris]|nr:hypothetical protein DFH09DRAFT_1314819 [Mycena vulgaris]